MRCRGPWSEEEARSWLDAARIPVRVACVGESGWPTVVSLWFLRDGDALCCATPAAAHVVSLLGENPRCGFEVATSDMPYKGVRGRARARIDAERGPEALRALADRYLGREYSGFRRWLLERPVLEVEIRLELESLTSWDFSARMGGGTS